MAYSELVCIRGCIIISCSVTWRSGPQNFRTCRTKFQNGDSSCRASSACWCHWYWRRFLIGIFLALNLWNVSFATLIYPIFFTDGTLAVASSALTGRTWNGSLWLFKDRAKAPDVHYCSAGCATESGTTDIKWIDSRRLVLGSDTGTVDIWCLSGSFQSLENMASLSDHDNTISSVSVDCVKSKIVSGSWDRW